MMLELTMETGLFLLATAAFGLVIGWAIRGVSGKRLIAQLVDDWQEKVDQLIRQKTRSTVEISGLLTTIESQEALVHRHELAVEKARTNLQSEFENTKSLKKDIFTLRSEREDFKHKLSIFQDALVLVKQRAAELQTEFIKSGDFYKAELAKSFEKRKLLEAKINDAKLEHSSFSNLLQASRSEHDSANKMLESAQTRLGNLDDMEQKVIQLEAENAQLNHDAVTMRQDIEALHRDIAELEELKVQNKEMSHCLKSMEVSRKQHEDDAQRYRDHAGQSEKQSETLRIKLDEVEKNFSEMEKEQRVALKEVRNKAVVRKMGKKKAEKKEVDDLQKIVGVGKVFEGALHKLGIYNYRQIAAFGVSDIARINAELKEFKGRMEQDDWIGQAKELYFQKYGGKDIH
jgi:predicted flap endonuclease-1-like 5' DNA nuclease